ncbi:MAG: hypothetical protein U9R69_10510, partial [Thermodesulfobacteriota bacterium]|nr:hypothetical protein [Thermodesulfobacteriota bacterium]
MRQTAGFAAGHSFSDRLLKFQWSSQGGYDCYFMSFNRKIPLQIPLLSGEISEKDTGMSRDIRGQKGFKNGQEDADQRISSGGKPGCDRC